MIHFLEVSAWIIGTGLLGIFTSLFMKAGDYNKVTPDVNIGGAIKKFILAEWPSYGLSTTMLLLIATTHDEWLQWFSSSKYTAYTIFAEFGGMVKLASFGIMFIVQHGIYKSWLGKLIK